MLMFCQLDMSGACGQQPKSETRLHCSDIAMRQSQLHAGIKPTERSPIDTEVYVNGEKKYVTPVPVVTARGS